MTHRTTLEAGTDRITLRERYLHVETPNVCDVLDELGYRNQGLAHDFDAFPREAGPLAGWAYTILGESGTFDETGDPAKMRAVEGISAGDVSVWSGGELNGIGFFGELIALGMKVRGCAGALVDGGVRDIKWIGEQGFPVYARFRTPVQSIGRWKVKATQVAIQLPGATSRTVSVRPGDFILADIDGAVVIPSEVVVEVLERTEALTNQEKAIRSELSRGATLEEVLDRYGHV